MILKVAVVAVVMIVFVAVVVAAVISQNCRNSSDIAGFVISWSLNVFLSRRGANGVTIQVLVVILLYVIGR